MSTFYEFGLSSTLIKAISGMGFEEATSIQEQAIPIALKGKDVIGQAQTGTGKTAAFGIPMIEKCDPVQGVIQGLVITPTRELAIQVAEELNSLGHYSNLRSIPIYGGQKIERQIKALKNKPQIIVATPGRLMDHMRRKLIRLQHLTTVILDEADEMLNMGFREDIETILSYVPTDRQTMLFSATMPQPIKDLACRFMQEPEFIRIKTKEITVSSTEQYSYKVHEKEKFDALSRLLDLHSPEAAIIFARTKRRVDELADALIKRGYCAEAIHGDLTQTQRDSTMNKFRNGSTEILVATDVAARGLDIGSVTHVYNFDIPQDPDSYVHRIGRTGRLGKPGLAVTLVSSRETSHLELIERSIKRKITRKPVPTIRETLEEQQRLTAGKLFQTIEADEHLEYKKTALKLLEDSQAANLIAAALKLLTREPDQTPVHLTDGDFWTTKKNNQGKNRKKQGYRRKPGKNDNQNNYIQNRSKKNYLSG